MADLGGIESQTGDMTAAGLDDEDERFIVSFDLIDHVVVHEIAGSVED